MEMIWIWLAVVAVSLIVEFFTWDLTSIWFAVAGLISMILSAIDGINWVWQLAVFLVVSAVLIIFVRQICRKFLLKHEEKTNVEAYAGKRTKLLSAIGENENYGTVKFNGVIWNAIAEDNKAIDKDSDVEIIRVDGNKMIVKKVASIDESTTKEEAKNNIIEENQTENEKVIQEKTEKQEKKSRAKTKKDEE